MRVVVFGGGYAGIVAVKRLEHRLPEEASILLVDRRPHHLVRHELHRVIRRPSVAEHLQVPFETILDRGAFRQGRVAELEPDEGTATFESGDSIEYDAGIVSFGAAPATYGIEDVTTHGMALDTLSDAESIAKRMATLLDRGSGTVVVAGAGLAGVQAAGELAERQAEATGSDVKIVLLEQADRVAPSETTRFSTAVADRLREKGVTVRTGTTVTGVAEDRIETQESDLEWDLFVWTGGITGSSVFDGERPHVRSDLRLGDRTFAAGDAVRVIDQDGSMVTPTAQTAVGMAAVAADNAIKRTESAESGFGPSYDRYREGNTTRMVTVGDDAVARIGPAILTGPAARTLKSFVGSRYLSTAGAIESAVSLVRMEFGLAHPRTGDGRSGL